MPLLLLIFAASFLSQFCFAQQPTTRDTEIYLVGRVGQPRKLAVLPSGDELWTAPIFFDSPPAPLKTITLIYLTKRADASEGLPIESDKSSRIFPPNTEIKQKLTRRSDGTFEDIYYYETRHNTADKQKVPLKPQFIAEPLKPNN
jgi:hypothetical protein